jgi:hypothetical protein
MQNLPVTANVGWENSIVYVGSFHENFPQVVNTGNQRNSTILQVSVAMQQHFHSKAYAQQCRSAVAMIRPHSQ